MSIKEDTFSFYVRCGLLSVSHDIWFRNARLMDLSNNILLKFQLFTFSCTFTNFCWNSISKHTWKALTTQKCNYLLNALICKLNLFLRKRKSVRRFLNTVLQRVLNKNNFAQCYGARKLDFLYIARQHFFKNIYSLITTRWHNSNKIGTFSLLTVISVWFYIN